MKASQYFNLKYEIKNKNLFFKESKLLKLNSEKAKKIIFWTSRLNFNETIDLTMKWYNKYINKKNNNQLYLETINQIRNYYLKIQNVPNKKNKK